MKIVFFGSSDFAILSLDKLLKNNYDIAAVVTQPDRKKGRHLKLSSCPVKVFATAGNLLVNQAENLNSEETNNFLKSLSADLFVVVSYGKILPGKILRIPKIFAINLHASLLPEYRGAAPINWAIINGEKMTGVTIIKMDEYIDKGDIIRQEKVEITDTDTAISLSSKLSLKGAELLVQCIEDIKRNNFSLSPQDESKVSYAPELKKEDGLISWSKDALYIYNQIRGMMPWPGAFTYYQSKLLKLWKVEVSSPAEGGTIHQPGRVINISKDGITITCGKGNLVIKELQIEGKRQMTVDEFIRGHKIEVGVSLG